MAGAGEPHRILLVLADLRGFSRYTRASRMAAIHGRGILADLLQRLADGTSGPWNLGRIDGDGLNFVLDLDGVDGVPEGFHARLEALVQGFLWRQQELVAANTCPCEACQAVQRIRLKVLVHCGTALVRVRKGRVEATGADVNQAYRLRDRDLHAVTHLLLTPSAWKVLGGGAEFDAVDLGPAHEGDDPAYLRTFEGLEEMPPASRWARIRLTIRKMTWDFRFRSDPEA